MTAEEMSHGCKRSGEECIALAEKLSAEGLGGQAIGLGMLTASVGFLISRGFAAEDIMAGVAEIIRQAKEIER